MKKNLLISLMLLPFLFVGCVLDRPDEFDTTETEHAEFYVSDHSVSLSQALETMYAAFDNLYSPTRSSRPAILGIDSIKYADVRPLTRNAENPESGVLPENLIYIVNFENDSGFAMLGADQRIGGVIALTESGGFDASSLFCEESTRSGADSEGDSGVNSAFLSDIISNYLLSVCEAIEEDAGGTEETADAGPGTRMGNEGTYWTRTRVEYGQWNISYGVFPLLETKWRQGSPFNNVLSIFRGKETLPGCVTIALAQIIAYNQFPDVSDYALPFGHSWDELTSHAYKDKDTSEHIVYNRDVGSFIYRIWDDIPTIQSGDNWTFAFPLSAKNYLSNIGYSSVKKHSGYDYSLITGMLDKGYPVFTSALSGAVNGHAWVVDGYVRCWREVTKTTTYHGNLPYTPNQTETRSSMDPLISTYNESANMVHCNWGWAGNCDGYYMSGIFNLSHGPEMFASGDLRWETEGDYDHWFRTITYKID